MVLSPLAELLLKELLIIQSFIKCSVHSGNYLLLLSPFRLRSCSIALSYRCGFGISIGGQCGSLSVLCRSALKRKMWWIAWRLRESSNQAFWHCSLISLHNWICPKRMSWINGKVLRNCWAFLHVVWEQEFTCILTFPACFKKKWMILMVLFCDAYCDRSEFLHKKISIKNFRKIRCNLLLTYSACWCSLKNRRILCRMEWNYFSLSSCHFIFFRSRSEMTNFSLFCKTKEQSSLHHSHFSLHKCHEWTLFTNLYCENIIFFYHEGNCPDTVFQSRLILYLADSFCLAIE